MWWTCGRRGRSGVEGWCVGSAYIVVCRCVRGDGETSGWWIGGVVHPFPFPFAFLSLSLSLPFFPFFLPPARLALVWSGLVWCPPVSLLASYIELIQSIEITIRLRGIQSPHNHITTIPTTSINLKPTNTI